MLLNLPGSVWGVLIGLVGVLLLPLLIIWVAYRYFRE